jgi:hypothetical protein
MGPADDRLHDIRGMTAGFEGASSDRGEVGGGPCGGFGALDYDGIASEDRGYDGTDEVVKLRLVRQTEEIGARGAYWVAGIQVS